MLLYCDCGSCKLMYSFVKPIINLTIGFEAFLFKAFFKTTFTNCTLVVVNKSCHRLTHPFHPV